MAFKVKLNTSAKKDLFKAINYYSEINPILANRFFDEFHELNILLGTNSYFGIKYKYVRTYKLKSFPYVLYFVVNEEDEIVSIIAIVFGKQQKTNFMDRLSDI